MPLTFRIIFENLNFFALSLKFIFSIICRMSLRKWHNMLKSRVWFSVIFCNIVESKSKKLTCAENYKYCQKNLIFTLKRYKRSNGGNPVPAHHQPTTWLKRSGESVGGNSAVSPWSVLRRVTGESRGYLLCPSNFSILFFAIVGIVRHLCNLKKIIFWINIHKHKHC